MKIEEQKQTDSDKVEQLLDLSFGADRHLRAAYAYRRGVEPVAGLSFVVRADDETLLATLRFWPVTIAGHDVLLLGPIAVHPDYQGKGYGVALMKHGLERARALGHSRVILVGDEPYYARLGFTRAMAARLTMAGQDDLSRLLAMELRGGSFDGICGPIEKV